MVSMKEDNCKIKWKVDMIHGLRVPAKQEEIVHTADREELALDWMKTSFLQH